MNETMQTLPGEGERKYVVKIGSRQECEVCGAPAHYKRTYLLVGARDNPHSSAYRHDDCSWCEDEARFLCEEHKSDRTIIDGYEECARFPANEKFAHMFLYWREEDISDGGPPELVKLREANAELVDALQQLYNCVPLSAEGPDLSAKIVTSVGYWRTAFDKARAALTKAGAKP